MPLLVDQPRSDLPHFIRHGRPREPNQAGYIPWFVRYDVCGSCLTSGSGSMSIPLVYATKREPTVIGKPHRPMMDAILAE